MRLFKPLSTLIYFIGMRKVSASNRHRFIYLPFTHNAMLVVLLASNG